MSDEEILKALDESTVNARQLQFQTLRSIIARNWNTRYLSRHLSDRPISSINAETFRNLVPLSSYDDYEDLIRQIADGVESPSALCSDPLLCFFYRLVEIFIAWVFVVDF